MRFLDFILLGWIFKYVTADQYNESISFSPNQSSITVPSFWHDIITFPQNNSIIEQGINVQIQLNEFNGLLFYAIDNKYRTFWVEFSEENLELYYYNFNMDESKKFSIKISEICISINSNKFNLKFSTKNDQIEIVCNDNSVIIGSSNFNLKDYLLSSISDRFFDTFPLPIPQFGNSTKDIQVHLWIGNTPSIVNKTLYRNTKLTPNFKNLFGCVQSLSINNILLKLASTGVHYGEMISRYCQPICTLNPCYNNGKCIELWRKQYSCDCGKTYFLGKHCDLEYSIRFDGSFSFQDFVDFNFTSLMFSFVYYKSNDVKPIVALELSENKTFLIYISKSDYIHARFNYSILGYTDRRYTFAIAPDKRYIVSTEVKNGNILVNIQNTDSDSKTEYIPINRTNLIINHINVGNYKFKGTENIFKGCVTNLVLKSEAKEFIWNKMNNFSNYPSCNEFIKTASQTKCTSTQSITNDFTTENVTMSTITSAKYWRNNNFIYYIIAAIVIVIIIIVIISGILYRFRKELGLEKPNKENTAEYSSLPDNVQPLRVYTLPRIFTPKPPHFSKLIKVRKESLAESPSFIPKVDEIAV